MWPSCGLKVTNPALNNVLEATYSYSNCLGLCTSYSLLVFATILAKCFATTFKVRCHFMWHVCQFIVHFPWQQALMRSLFFQFVVSQGPCILVQCSLQLICIRFYWPYLNKVLEMVSFSLQTSRKHFVLYEGRYNSNASYFFSQKLLLQVQWNLHKSWVHPL